MNPNLKWKALFILAVILICIYVVIGYPSFPTSLAGLKDNFTHQIKLGLDLQGGTHMRTKGTRYEEVRRVDDTHFLVRGLASDQYSQFRDLYHDQYEISWELGSAPGQPNAYLLTLRQTAIARIQETTMALSVETIERRINALGLTEPTIQLHGRKDNEILVQLPGEGDPSEARRVISAGGQLELRLVEDPNPYPTEVAALAAHGGILPPATEIVRGTSQSRNSQNPSDTGENYYLLDRTPVVTGRDLKNAVESRNPDMPGQYQVSFTLSREAASRFGPFTEQNKGRQMAIVLEHKVYSAPVIQSRIEDQGRIDGNFSQESAHELALVLRAGALPASIKYLEERTVGPSLGADSIRHGVQASVLSLVVVMIFMVFYYRLSGGNAVLALILNLVILMAVLAAFGAVLTLPGIAGVIMTIG